MKRHPHEVMANSAVESPYIDGAPDALQIPNLDRTVGAFATVDRNFDKQSEITDRVEYRSIWVESMMRDDGLLPLDDPTAQEKYDFAKQLYTTAAATDSYAAWVGTSYDQPVSPRNQAIEQIRSLYKSAPIATAPTTPTTPPVAAAQFTPITIDTFEYTHVVSEKPTSANNSQTADKKRNRKLEQGSAIDEKLFKALTVGETEDGEKVSDSLPHLMDEYAKKIARRSGRSIERTKTGEDIEKSGTELSGLLAGLASEMYARAAAEGVEHEDIVRMIDTFIYEQTELTLQKIEEHRLAKYNRARPYVQKVFNTWAEWGGEKEWFSKGRLKKTAAIAVPSAAAGIALAPLVGALGASVLVGGMAAVGMRSVGRNLANGVFRNRDKNLAQDQTQEMKTELDREYTKDEQLRKSRQLQYEEMSPAERKANSKNGAKQLDIVAHVAERSREYRLRNRRRLIGGTAIAMTVGLLSSTASDILTDALDQPNWIPDRILGRIGNPFADHNVDEHTPGNLSDLNDQFNTDENDDTDPKEPEEVPRTPIGKDTDGDTIFDRNDPDIDGDGRPNGTDFAPRDPTIQDAPDVTEPELDWSDFNRDARYVEPGEGGWQTLQEMGIPEHKWEKVWEDAGTELSHGGKTYRMDDGRWGWSDDMRLTNKDLDILADAAEKNGVELAA